MGEDEWDGVKSYARSRKRDVLMCLGLARIQLAQAIHANAETPCALNRALLVRTMANLEIATAIADAWETPLGKGPETRLFPLPRPFPQS